MKVSKVLRRSEGRYWHFCPSCKKYHPLPDTWTFDGDLESPTFTPSFKQYLGKGEISCHYIITKGKIYFCSDSNMDANKIMDMVELPDEDTEWGF